MRRWLGGLAFVAMSVSIGCTGTHNVRPDQWITQLSPRGQNSQFIQVDVALIERPVGDPFLNQDIWNHTDEQIVDLQQKARLEENGLRVGQVIGMPPWKLQKLLTSKRSCANPRRRMIHSGYTTNVVLGPQRLEAAFELALHGRIGQTKLDKAQFQLQFTPTLTSDGKTKLVFTPKIVYGEPTRYYRPAPDKGDMTVEVKKPQKLYDDLQWDVSLAPNEFLVIGTQFTRPASFGFAAFVEPNGIMPVQRLLVIRTHRAAPGKENETETLEDLARTSHSLPLALQASISTTARASGR